MTPEKLKRIAEQVIEGKKLLEVDFGEPNLSLEEKLALVDLALKHYPSPNSSSGQAKDH